MFLYCIELEYLHATLILSCVATGCSIEVRRDVSHVLADITKTSDGQRPSDRFLRKAVRTRSVEMLWRRSRIEKASGGAT